MNAIPSDGVLWPLRGRGLSLGRAAMSMFGAM